MIIGEIKTYSQLYFVSNNLIIIGLLEVMLGSAQELFPAVPKNHEVHPTIWKTALQCIELFSDISDHLQVTKVILCLKIFSTY